MKLKKIAIVGMPNTGKSTLFRRLAKRNITVSPFQGTAVEIRRGLARIGGEDTELIDTPGIHSLVYQSEDGTVTKKILIGERPDVIIQVADAKDLMGSLVMTSLLADLNIPMIFVLNMVDEAEQRGIKVKRHRLEEILGIDVIETVASEGRGMKQLHKSLNNTRRPSIKVMFSKVIEDTISAVEDLMPPEISAKRAMAMLCISEDREVSQWAQDMGGITDSKEACTHMEMTRTLLSKPVDIVMARSRNQYAEEIFSQTVYFTRVLSTPLMEKIGSLLIQPFAGMAALFALLAAFYFIVGKLTAEYLVDYLDDHVFAAIISPRLDSAVSMIPSEFIREAITGQYGIYTMGIVPAFGLVLPVITVFYFIFGIIEDSGYFSRLSILLDRSFRKIGLNGKAVLPIVLGFSCVTSATMSARMLDSRKERFTTIFLLSLGVPCSAKLSVILVMLANESPAAFLTVFGVVFCLTIVSGLVLGRIMPDKRTRFIMQVPPIRVPSFVNIFKRTAGRSAMFLAEALPLFFIGAFALFLAARSGALSLMEQAAAPVIKGFIGLPAEFTDSLILGFIRGEAGIAALKRLADAGAMNSVQLVTAVVVTILFIPCVTNLLLIVKEEGMKKALLIVISVTVIAILTGGVMNYVSMAAGISL